jgi:hypothetical protein
MPDNYDIKVSDLEFKKAELRNSIRAPQSHSSSGSVAKLTDSEGDLDFADNEDNEEKD